MERSRTPRVRKRIEDLQGSRAQVAWIEKAWSEKNGDKVLKIAKKVLNGANAATDVFCNPCELPLATRDALELHDIRQEHLAADVVKPASKAGVAAVRVVRAKA